MSNEDALRKQVEELERDRLKKARRFVIMWGSIAIMALIAFVYGFVQRIEADLERETARIAAESCEKQRLELDMAMKQIEQMTIELEVCKASRK